MKELQTLNGGYKRHMDYLLTLQSEVLGVQNALFKNLGHDLVLSGCKVTDHLNGTVSIAPGVVYVDGEIIRFVGANNIVKDGSKALSKGAPVATDPDDFFDTSIKNTYKETFAVVSDTASPATQIVIKLALYDMKTYISDIVQSYGQKGELKDIYDLDGDFLDNFDNSGLGTTPRWIGWARVNGNNGTPNAQGRTRVTAGKIVSNGIEYIYANGDTGGEVKHKLLKAELPELKIPGQTGGDNSDHNNSYQFAAGDKSPDQNVYNVNIGGSGEAFSIMQPYIAVYTVIKIT